MNGNKYGGDYEHHHIVAQNDFRAILAQMILQYVGIDINDERNLVWVRKAIHKFMHINEYFWWVNREIGEAYYSSLMCNSMSASRQYVIHKLAILKSMIYSLNNLLK